MGRALFLFSAFVWSRFGACAAVGVLSYRPAFSLAFSPYSDSALPKLRVGNNLISVNLLIEFGKPLVKLIS